MDVKGRILVEEDKWVVIDKPPGIPTSGRSLDDPDCVQFHLMNHYGQMVWAVHQLDADTSGLNLFVREKKGVQQWKARMESPLARKVYLAVVTGVPQWEEMEVHEPIGWLDERNLGIHPDGKSAHSRMRVVGRGKSASLLQVEITTGRTHQIRIHAHHLGHPLLGEEWYVPTPCDRHSRQALHAFQMVLGTFRWTCPLPEDLGNLLAREGILWQSG